MADLDPKLQAELTEFIAHKNRQQRVARKYGPYVLLGFVALVVAGLLWQRSESRRFDEQREQMEREHDEAVERMKREHDEAVQEMHRYDNPAGPQQYAKDQMRARGVTVPSN